MDYKTPKMRAAFDYLRAQLEHCDVCDAAAAELAYPADDENDTAAADAPETAESDGAA